MLRGLLDDLGNVGPVVLCTIAFVLAYSETAIALDLLVPGEVGMVLVGASAASAGAPLPAVVAAAALGAALGDTTSYLIGRRWGRGIVERFRFTQRHLGPLLDAASGHFDRHGGRSVFLGRFVGALRAVVPLVAGAAKLPVRTFAAWNVAASICWASLVVGLGGLVGRSAADVIDRAETFITIVVVAALVTWLWWRHRRASKERTAGSPPETSNAPSTAFTSPASER